LFIYFFIYLILSNKDKMFDRIAIQELEARGAGQAETAQPA
jgi:hypothetical protein